MRKPTEPLAKTVRTMTGLTQEAFADKYRIDVGTLRGWEQGRREPDRTCELMLRMICVEPDMVALIIERASGCPAGNHRQG